VIKLPTVIEEATSTLGRIAKSVDIRSRFFGLAWCGS
jgi:hypothetical protein